MKRSCWFCSDMHNIYYLQKSNGELAMFILCPKAKGEDQIFIRFLPIEKNLSIDTYVSGSSEYNLLKESVVGSNGFSDAEKETISLWRRAKLTASMMTDAQKKIVKEYCKGKIKW